MTATAGLTVPHSINPIFQYIFDPWGKRSINQIVAFGTQKIQTSSFRSQRTHDEWLFGADFGFQKLKRMTWTTFDFNKSGPLATQPT